MGLFIPGALVEGRVDYNSSLTNISTNKQGCTHSHILTNRPHRLLECIIVVMPTQAHFSDLDVVRGHQAPDLIIHKPVDTVTENEHSENIFSFHNGVGGIGIKLTVFGEFGSEHSSLGHFKFANGWETSTSYFNIRAKYKTKLNNSTLCNEPIMIIIKTATFCVMKNHKLALFKCRVYSFAPHFSAFCTILPLALQKLNTALEDRCSGAHGYG
ncbi:hypothetical protein ANN_26480 [Periplaneta americana]|uniref:Uncharacterized protein n=1 Tax=Periplaneta americana TaxID=6978 RepID=A0ABQ8RYE7_PERAM|nr:hypothetical protein ANN_26480 [Periplaneta americana]